MSCSRRTELLLLLGAAACSDQRLNRLPSDARETGIVDSESRGSDTGRDSGGGRDSESPEPCSGGILSEDDGRPARLAETAGDETDLGVAASGFGLAVLPERAQEPLRLWVTTSFWYADTRPNWDGAYLLDVSAWDDDGVLAPDVQPTLYAEDGVHTLMVATGLTTDAFSPLGGFAVATPSDYHDEYDGTLIWLAASAPTRGTDLADWADVELHAEDAPTGQASTFADLDGDGLDDLLVPGYSTRIFLSPMAGSVGDEDADIEFASYLSGGVAPFQPEDAAASDLDDDGYLDLVWKQANGERDNHTQFDLLFKKGPIASMWDAPDAMIIDEVSALPELNWGSSLTQLSTVRAVGDVTGDGRPDVTASFSYDEGGREGSGSLIVVDAWPEGAVGIEDVPTRLVGIPGDLVDEPVRSNLGSGGSGDVNGDGFGDLVIFQAYTGLYDGEQYRSYVALGPLDGIVTLEDSSVQVRLARDPAASATRNAAALVPDIGGDGLDDVIVNVLPGGDLPGTVWLFEGCENW